MNFVAVAPDGDETPVRGHLIPKDQANALCTIRLYCMPLSNNRFLQRENMTSTR